MKEETRFKDKKAAALKYEPGDVAPRVVAHGAAWLADKIIKTAEDSGVHVHEDKELVEVLTQMNIGDAIPPELYDVVAKILVFVDELDRAKGMSRYNVLNK